MKKGMKKIINKQKKLLVVIATIVEVILVITGICINLGKSQNRMSISTPELARAMEYGQFVEGDDAVDNTENVKFSAFFLRDLNGDGYAEKIKGTCRPIGEEDTLYMEIIVQTEGYLKDAKVEIQGKNFYLQTALPKDEQLKDNCIGNNIKQIEFNPLYNGTQKLLSGIVRSGDYSYTTTKSSAIGNNINNYSREDNKIILTGTYVNETQEEIQITKEIPLTVDWYGTTQAEINVEAWRNTYYDLPDRINDDSIKLNVTIYTRETKEELILSKNHVEGTIPELNGYAPTEVKMVSNLGTFSYDAETRKFMIDRIAEAAEDGTVSKMATNTILNGKGYFSYNLEITYPIEAYQELGEDTVTIKLPIQTYYEGYNNPNTQFTNPYKSDIAKAIIVANYENPKGTVADFQIQVGKYLYNPSYRYAISKQKPLRIYNGISEEEKDDIYTVRWYAYTGTEGETTGLVMKETKDEQTRVTDEFIKVDSSTDSMEDITTNVGIYFTGVDNFLKEDGWIKVYDDETENLLVTFTKVDWGKYTSSNPYKYELPVKHIRVETSGTNKEASLYVYNIKELDDEYITENYTKEQFDNLKYIKSTLNGYLGENHIATRIHQANYEAPYSVATINLNKSTISTQETEEHEKMTITANYDEANNQIGWVDGSFLVKLPEEILAVEINSVEIDNSSVAITTYELIEQDTGKFIKINTKNDNNTPQSYKITIDADITPDPRLASVTRTIELYASNNEAVEYYYKAQDIYDVNDNLNTEEIVNKTTTSISLVAPGSLLTNQTASEYDSKNSMIVSPQIADIMPLYAKVDNEKQTAKIGVQLKNNYSSTISEVLLLGKIPFKGNTTVLSGKDLKSDFTTKMLNTGIQIPEALQGKVAVYYSENENPSKDLAKAENGWILKENVTNWDNIKTFIIDFGDVVIPRGTEYVFYYKIEIPQGIEFNKTSYSHHGIYFSLDTDEGKYRTQTEPNRIGFRIAEKFNLELIKTQTGKDKLVSGATYSITEVLEDGTLGEAKTVTTDAQGTLMLKDLYAEKLYEIKEIKTPEDYALNTDEVRIIGHVDENGTLTIEKTQGTTKEDVIVTKNEGEKHKVTVKVEDEAKSKLKITKKEQGTEINVKGAYYKVTAVGLPTSGRTTVTNVNGEAILKGLMINQEYILQEIKPGKGYYISDEIIKFKVVNNNGVYELQITEGNALASNLTEEDNLPIVTLTLENEKIPRYNLEIFKIKKTIETTLSTDELIAKAEGNLAGEETDVLTGAKFKLYKDDKQIGEYITGEDGKITINDLYQYVDGKDEGATYTLKEVLAPDGYAKAKDLTFKVQVIDGTLKLINIDGEEEKFSVEGSTIKLLIEDSPSFKLIKKDAETGEILANVKFAIYNVDNGIVPATNSKGEIIGAKEIINGKEYYTVTTDSNGIITADLIEGYYKAVELQAPDKYDITDSTYYFGIGASSEGKIGLQADWAKGIGGSSEDSINSVVETSDGGYVVGGYFKSSSIDLGNGVTITNHGSTSYYDGMVVKYSSIGDVEWAKSIGGSNDDQILSVTETSDGSYIIGGYFYGSIDLGNGVMLSSNGGSDGMLIKYKNNGDIEWAKTIGGSNNDQILSVAETSDGGYVVGGYFKSSSINLGNGVTITNHGSTSYYDGMIIKYNSSEDVEWAKSIGGSNDDQILSVAETSDGGYVVGGYFKSSSINLENGVTVTNNSSTSYYDGMVIKYSSNGEAKWAKAIGGSSDDRITSVVETSNGDYVVGGYFKSSSIHLENEIELKGYYSGDSSYTDGMIIKYNEKGEAKWAKTIKERYDDQILSITETKDGGCIIGGYHSGVVDLGNDVVLGDKGTGMIVKYSDTGEEEYAKSINGSSRIASVVETRDGGYVVGGYFSSSNIDLGNGVTLTNHGNTSYYDGMIIKISQIESPKVLAKQANSIQGSKQDYINSVVGTSDGGYVAVGYSNSSSIDLGNGVTLSSNDSTDGMLIKYKANGNVEWAKTIGGNGADEIWTVVQTSDGGYIVGGYFCSSSINLGNGVTITNQDSPNQSKGMIIKYNPDGEAEWAKVLGRWVYSVLETRDRGYIVAGEFYKSIELEKELTLTSTGSLDGMLIKYNSFGKVEWAKAIGGSDSDSILKVSETEDGGYVVGGTYTSSSLNLENGVTLTNSGYNDGMVIKYSSEGNLEWAKKIGGNGTDKIISLTRTSDGGCVAVGYFASYDINLENEVTLTNSGSGAGMIIKYSKEGETEWANEIGGVSYRNSYNLSMTYIASVVETRDKGYAVGGKSFASEINLRNGTTITNHGDSDTTDGILIKFNSNGETEWGKVIGESKDETIKSVIETTDGYYLVGGYFSSSSIDLGNGVTLKKLKNDYLSYDGMIIKVKPSYGTQEVQELEIKNVRKEFRITTDVKEIDGVRGGTISGEDRKSYETVKYGDSNTKDIIMTPDQNYEIIRITVNGEECPFVANEDGSYTMPSFTNIIENKHIEVTYSLKDNKIIINKIDSETREILQGATFKLDQLEERKEPENILGTITNNGQEYTSPDKTKEVTTETLGDLTANGEVYTKIDVTTDTLGTLTNNGDYYFTGTTSYIPTNSKSYSGTGKGNTTANSYIPIDLSNKTGKFTVVVNAQVYSESNADYGYATITETTTAPTYDNSVGQFIKISGIINSQDYTSMELEGGKTYYLHLGYRKNSSGDEYSDLIVFNSIKVYELTNKTYNFIKNNGKYESNNQGQANTVANSYIPIDLTNETGTYSLIVNANVSSQSSYDYGYATITENTDRPAYNSSTGRFIYTSGTSESVTTPSDYMTLLEGGKKYYLHLGYYKNASTDTGDDKFTVNSVKLYETKNTTYSFIENEKCGYESNNQGLNNTVANSYVPIDLTNYEGKYNLIVNANISSQSGGDYGYATITENTDRPSYSTSTGRFIYISGKSESVTTPTDYSTILEGGKLYYLHFGYYKNYSASLGDDKFTINSIKVTTNGDHLYHTEVTTNSEGQAITQIPFGRYAITETKAPEGYELNENSVVVEFRADENHEFTIENNKLAKVIVHHYIKGTTAKVTEDEVLEDKAGHPYIAIPQLDLEKYELEKGEDGNYIMPENATGQFASGEQEVIYYYVAKEIPLIVKHYIEGTETPVSLFDGSNAETVTSQGKEGETYTTTAIPNSELSSEYELVEIPSNSTGTYQGNRVEVTYYYKKVVRNLIINKYAEDDVTPLEGAIFTIKNKNATDDIETQQYTTNNQGKINTTLATGEYVITEIQAPEGYQLSDNVTREITITRDTKEILVDMTNIKKQGKVIVHYYLEGTQTPITLANGTAVQSVEKIGTIGDMYVTVEASNIATKYELVAVPENASGNIAEETVVIYYYRLKDTSVLVHHYKEGTEESVSPDVIINGQIDDEYTAEVANDILDVYELVETPVNANGVMTEEQIVVTYYYSIRVANITHAKSQQIETGKNFVTVGDKITYTVTISNSGNLEKDVVVKDNIPTGTSFVEESIKVDGVAQTNKTAQDLANGITINVPMAENGEASARTLSFEVTVDEGTIGDIKNTATVDEENTNETTVPVVTYEKEATITRRAEESTLAENEVTAGDTISYVIKVHNTGTTKVEGIEVRDTAPTGTALKTIENGGVETDSDIVWTISEIEANKTAEVGLTVEVQYLRQDTTIKNRATVEGKETNETENPYKKLPLVEESKVEKKATEKITTKDMKVYYEIKFTTTINYFDGKAKITLVDTLPYPINVEESEIAGGIYDETTKTITWEEELNSLPVIIDGMTIERTKILNLRYDYGNIDDIAGALINKINSRIDLLEPSEENPDEYVGAKVDEREAIAETLVEIPTQVKVHHYIYDVEKNEYTTVKLAEDETINGIIGQEYQTSPSSSVSANYMPLNTTPEKYEGKMIEEIIEVTYYYQLTTSMVENTIEKTATASDEDENGVAILTKEDGEVIYDIKYKFTIKDYIGKATIEIIDTLPEVIDVQKSDLAGGRYDETTKTITWTENVEGIDTFTNGVYNNTITKQIKLVYSNQNVLEDLVNTITGTTKIYYPENHATKPGEEQLSKTATAKETVKQEYKVTLRVNKKWMDNEDLKGKRPESVTIEIKAMPDGEVLIEILNAENGWMCEITDLPKYDAEGNKIIYVVTEKETEVGDLEFYEDAQITNVETQTEEVTNYIFTVINAYKLLNTGLITELTKEGTAEITSSKDIVEYNINIKVEVIDYIGAGKVRIVDTLPYKIDEEKSELAEGIYDDVTQTITWEEELPHINTETLGESYKEEITKQIKVVYKDIDLTTDKMTNKVNGKVELYDSEVKDEDETTHDTNINVEGKVIVKYVDKNTGKDIDENYNYEITGKVGEDYTSESKEIENYEYIESTDNETGKITEGTKEVIYYYIKTEATVLVKYQDTEGNNLLQNVLISGNVLDKYTTEQKEIENYRFVSVTDNKEGTMTKEQIVVIYTYEKIPAKVIVKYLEKDIETGEEKELLTEETIEGFVGDDYKTERKVIENYKSSEPEPDNKTGKMTEETTEVIYYYERIPSGIITVTYVDIDTKEEITYKTETEEEKSYRYEIQGYIGDEYETEEKVIPYYAFVENTENTKGLLTEKEDTVTYYYRKLIFNLAIDKSITGITLNGKAVKATNNKFTKVEVRSKQIEATELIVSYVINVKNDGEIKGKANIEEIIPQGYEVINQEGYWKATNGALEAEVELDAGEERDLSVNLKWLNSENNIGTTTNIVKIDKIENAANYEEITTEDNTSSAQVIIGITTGPKFETIFKIELAMSVVIILLLVLNINEVSIIRKKK